MEYNYNKNTNLMQKNNNYLYFGQELINLYDSTIFKYDKYLEQLQDAVEYNNIKNIKHVISKFKYDLYYVCKFCDILNSDENIYLIQEIIDLYDFNSLKCDDIYYQLTNELKKENINELKNILNNLKYNLKYVSDFCNILNNIYM